MKSDDLKKCRKELGAQQKDLAKILDVPFRTYQNWEQPEESKQHRRIPDDIADRVQCLVDMKGDQGGSYIPRDLVWLQVPLREREIEALEKKALFEDKNVTTLVREWIVERL